MTMYAETYDSTYIDDNHMRYCFGCHRCRLAEEQYQKQQERLYIREFGRP